jgi:hypothetical protein
MNSTLLRWLANGTIATVLVSALWLAGAVQSPTRPPEVFQLARAASPMAAPAASAAQR